MQRLDRTVLQLRVDAVLPQCGVGEASARIAHQGHDHTMRMITHNINELHENTPLGLAHGAQDVAGWQRAGGLECRVARSANL